MAYPYPARYPASRSPTFKIPSIRTVAQTIYRTEGPKGFFRGLTPSLLRAFPANACALYVYETTMSLLDAEKVCSLSHSFNLRADYHFFLLCGILRHDIDRVKKKIFYRRWWWPTDFLIPINSIEPCNLSHSCFLRSFCHFQFPTATGMCKFQQIQNV